MLFFVHLEQLVLCLPVIRCLLNSTISYYFSYYYFISISHFFPGFLNFVLLIYWECHNLIAEEQETTLQNSFLRPFLHWLQFSLPGTKEQLIALYTNSGLWWNVCCNFSNDWHSNLLFLIGLFLNIFVYLTSDCFHLSWLVAWFPVLFYYLKVTLFSANEAK